jgi:hypothetical protein
VLLGRDRLAGRYAHDRYKLGLKRWRRWVRGVSLAISAPLFLLGVAALVFSHGTVLWLGGALFGLGTAAWIWLRDTPPDYVENWNTGAEGERKTAKALRSLKGLEWRIFHDIQTGYGNYDHVVVSPGGVFLLETKYLGGIIEMRDGVPCVRRKLYPDQSKPYGDIRRQALSSAARLKGEIEELSGYRTWVQAVVVFWSDFPEGIYEDEHCAFVHGPRLRSWLLEQSRRLDLESVQLVSAGVEAVCLRDREDIEVLARSKA